MAVVVSGIKPTGIPHLGNYVGMLQPGLDLAQRHQVHHFIADLHALTTLPSPRWLQTTVLDATAVLLAVGFEPAHTVLFRQSDVPEIPELAWILSCLTPVGELERAHAYKDAVASGESVNHGLFSYPVLMAADILALCGTLVPVGPDQKQHLEIARDLARRFNHHYGDTLPIPKPLLPPSEVPLPGLDGQKMSKRYGNTIPIVAPPDEIRRLVAGIVTDSTPRDAPKDPDASAVFQIFRRFADPEQTREMAGGLRDGVLDWKGAKERLADVLIRELGPIRKHYRHLRKDTALLERVLEQGAERAGERTRKTLKHVRERVGLSRSGAPDLSTDERLLSYALDKTFPASDPLSCTQPKGRARRSPRPETRSATEERGSSEES